MEPSRFFDFNFPLRNLVHPIPNTYDRIDLKYSADSLKVVSGLRLVLHPWYLISESPPLALERKVPPMAWKFCLQFFQFLDTVLPALENYVLYSKSNKTSSGQPWCVYLPRYYKTFWVAYYIFLHQNLSLYEYCIYILPGPALMLPRARGRFKNLRGPIL